MNIKYWAIATSTLIFGALTGGGTATYFTCLALEQPYEQKLVVPVEAFMNYGQNDLANAISAAEIFAAKFPSNAKEITLGPGTYHTDVSLTFSENVSVNMGSGKTNWGRMLDLLPHKIIKFGKKEGEHYTTDYPVVNYLRGFYRKPAVTIKYSGDSTAVIVGEAANSQTFAFDNIVSTSNKSTGLQVNTGNQEELR